MSNLDREDALDRALSGQSQQERLIDSAAAAICGQAYELMLSHTISGKWSDSVLPIKAEHDMLLEMAGELKSLKASSPEISDNSGSDSEKPNSSEAVAWSWENHGRQVTVDKAFADELISDGEIVRPLIFGDTHPASAEVERLQSRVAAQQLALNSICTCSWGAAEFFDVGKAASWMQKIAYDALDEVPSTEAFILRK